MKDIVAVPTDVQVLRAVLRVPDAPRVVAPPSSHSGPQPVERRKLVKE